MVCVGLLLAWDHHQDKDDKKGRRFSQPSCSCPGEAAENILQTWKSLPSAKNLPGPSVNQRTSA